MKLKFEISKYHLAGYTIISPYKPFSTWEKLEERIWKKYRYEPAYYFLNSQHINWALEQIQIDSSKNNIRISFKKHASTLEKIYQEVFRSNEFKRLHKETEKYFKLVKNQWSKNEKEALKILQQISGLPLPKGKITVYITHPKSRNGKTINKNTIVFGHKEDWKNYSTVYLSHELLHIMTWPSRFEPHYNILHTLICLTTNNELRIRLNKNGKYFKQEKFNTEYPEIIKLEKKLLPYWKKYLKGGLRKENIMELKTFLTKK